MLLQTVISENILKPKKLWQHIGNLTRTDERKIKVGTQTVTDEVQLAELFNSYFVKWPSELLQSIGSMIIHFYAD